ncbi:transcriptional regulator PpsR [Aestuariibius insulae]|uniref:transcriptional regulator PpsR n=1 Tax=Aestuariibius insulae TaxID=2058287 RepID=UPI00345EE6F1
MTSRGAKYWSSGSIPLIGPDILGDIIAAVADIALVISENGAILSVLVDAEKTDLSTLDHWEGENMRSLLTVESVPKFEDRLAEFLDDPAVSRSVELNHLDQKSEWEFPIRYSFHRIGPDGAILMLGRDLRLVSELQQQLVKTQIALEMDYESQRDTDTRYRALMSATRDAAVYVSMSKGRIVDANAPALKRLGLSRESVPGTSFLQVFDPARRDGLLDELADVALSGDQRTVSVALAKTGREVLLVPKVFRTAGEKMILCRIDLDDDVANEGDPTSDRAAALYETGIEAMLFVDKFGSILSANDAFLGLTGFAHGLSVKGRPLSDFLSRGSIDLKILLDNAKRSGHMKMYATRLKGAFDAECAVEISASILDQMAEPVVGMILRDASRNDAVRAPQRNETDSRSIRDLMGSATLRDIVAETTDVVEKMCIETAVELTGNNRVAAAEMLGLSRQSLYVKLRKYGLLNKGGDT